MKGYMTDREPTANEETLRVVLIEDDERLARLTAK